MTVGQQYQWERAEAEKENARRANSSRHQRDNWDLKFFKPQGNPGPGRVAKVVKLNRKGHCVFEWTRKYLRVDSWCEADRPILTDTAIDPSRLLNISAYTPGDFKLFYADPRSRRNYLKWAPFLLTAEDYYAGKVKLRKEEPTHEVDLDAEPDKPAPEEEEEVEFDEIEMEEDDV